MSTLDLVITEIAETLSKVQGISRVVDSADEINDAGFIGVIELADENPYITLAGASEFFFTMYVMKLNANPAQVRKDMYKLMKLVDRKFMNTGPTTADFWIIQRTTRFGSFGRNNSSYQGFSKVIKVVGDFD